MVALPEPLLTCDPSLVDVGRASYLVFFLLHWRRSLWTACAFEMFGVFVCFELLSQQLLGQEALGQLFEQLFVSLALVVAALFQSTDSYSHRFGW